MEINWWYRLVASDLVHWYQQALRSIAIIKAERDAWQDKYEHKVLECSQQLEDMAKSDSALAADLAKERAKMGSVLTAREHAATQRIRDLENDNIFLLGEVQRLKAKLAKFRQS